MKRTSVSTAAVWSAALVMGFGMGALAGCEKEGPMEKTGKQVDKAAEDAGEAVEKAGDELKDATKSNP